MSVHESVPQKIDQPKRPYSIDLSLELERQLDNESLPPTPAPEARPQSMDQHVLASIVCQLRATVEELTKECDQLRKQVTKLECEKAGAEHSLLQFSNKCTQMEAELERTQSRMKEDEHSINMLRTKVEESRCVSFQ
jgi:predicted RNase H-like nuclease (RuvC/YqgF family)